MKLLMIRIRNFTALPLLFIILFPVVYEPIHLIHNHQSKINSDSYPDSHNRGISIIGTTVELCPICTYETAVYNLPETGQHKAGFIGFQELTFQLPCSVAGCYSGWQVSLRAPPATS